MLATALLYTALKFAPVVRMVKTDSVKRNQSLETKSEIKITGYQSDLKISLETLIYLKIAKSFQSWTCLKMSSAFSGR